MFKVESGVLPPLPARQWNNADDFKTNKETAWKILLSLGSEIFLERGHTVLPRSHADV